jgi:peptidoglycan/LPS O-acetylase OafA/YrhL
MASAPNLNPLTSIRFFAALAVVFFHFGQFRLLEDHVGWANNIIGAGYIGVSLFFVLSGFILTYTVSFKKNQFNPVVFWQARFARIYPLYLLGLLLAVPYYVVAMSRHGASPLALPLAPLLLQAWAPNAALAWNSPAWTLSVEAVFYFIFPFVISKIAHVRLSRALLLCAAAWLALLAPPTAAALLVPGSLGVTPEADLLWLNLLKFNPLFHLGEFIMGILTAKLFLANAGTLNPWVARISVLLLLLIMALSPSIPYIFLHNGLLAPLFALIIYALAGSGNRMMNSRPLLILGESSYALYILHVPLWILLRFAAAKVGFELQSGPGFVVYLLTVVALSVLSFYTLERPARRALTRWFAGRAGPVPTEPTSR